MPFGFMILGNIAGIRLDSLTPVASFTKEVNLKLAKCPLVYNGRLANRGLTSLVKEATGSCGGNFKSMIIKLSMQNSILGTQCEIALRWMPQNLTNEKTILVPVMAWCCKATSH